MATLYPHISKCLQRLSYTSNVRFVGYESSVSLHNLYPGSNLNITTPTKFENDGNQKFSGYIPTDKIQMTFSRSTGPGGQNVNKVNTKVDLRFHLESADWLSEDIKKTLQNSKSLKITKEGYLVFRSDVTRSQQLNVADCLEKLRCAIRQAAEPVVLKATPETIECMRQRHERAIGQRLSVKRERSRIKQDRRVPDVL